MKLHAKRFSRGHWTFVGPGDEKKWYGTRDYKPEGKLNSIASQMVQKFKETGRPVFTSVSVLKRGTLRRLKGKDPIHFNADVPNAELLFKIIFSANQLSIYGAVSNLGYQFGLREDE